MNMGNRPDRVSAFYIVNTVRTHCASQYSKCVSPYWEQKKNGLPVYDCSHHGLTWCERGLAQRVLTV